MFIYHGFDVHIQHIAKQLGENLDQKKDFDEMNLSKVYLDAIANSGSAASSFGVKHSSTETRPIAQSSQSNRILKDRREIDEAQDDEVNSDTETVAAREELQIREKMDQGTSECADAPLLDLGDDLGILDADVPPNEKYALNVLSTQMCNVNKRAEYDYRLLLRTMLNLSH